MELKQLPVDKVLANFYQPRIKFDKEKLKELAETILSNGLISPITVRKWKDKWMIVAGERRWRGHKIGKIKTIQAFIKEYKNEGQFMVESLVENLHREDLIPMEKGKFCLKIMKEEKITSTYELAKKINQSQSDVDGWIDSYRFKKRMGKHIPEDVPHKITRSTRTLPDKERKEIMKFAKKEGKSGGFIEEKFVPVFKKADEPTKKALLSGKVTVEEAKREPIPEPIQLEETANDVADDILGNMSSMTDNINKLLKEMNLEDLTSSKKTRLMTSSGILVAGAFARLVNSLKKIGVKPDLRILALIKANGKI